MAAIPIQITNAKFVGGGQTIDDCTLKGDISLSNVQVGGGPIIPDGVPPDPVDPPPQPERAWEAKTLWTPNQGWCVVLVPAPDTLVPTPSKRR